MRVSAAPFAGMPAVVRLLRLMIRKRCPVSMRMRTARV